MKEKLVVIVGPTAVGKTKLSIQLAKKWNGEIISGDSMQIYRSMDIGTAKVTPEEMDGIPHYMIDIKNPDESFSVVLFQQLVKQHIDHIHKKGRLPILVGGTGLYVQSVLYNYEFADVSKSDDYRKSLEKIAEEQGGLVLYERLKKVDPEAANLIHPNNVRRVIRALEVFEATGVPFSKSHHQAIESPYDATVIGLEMERTLLYERINRRVDHMIENGLIDEVKRLYKQGYASCQSMQAIGYKEMVEAIQGHCTYDEAIERLKRNSRRYAKRQYTWFKNKMDVDWFQVTIENFDQQIKQISTYIAGKLDLTENKKYKDGSEKEEDL